jgi:hypothetical protein
VTTNWTTTPGSLLGTDNTPVIFVASAEPIAVSVNYGEGSEERIFRDGAFIYPFLSSTKVGLTFTLVRAGGWPVFMDDADPPQRRPMNVYVDPPPPQLDPGYGLLYSVDFSTLPNQTLAAGANTIDGQTWWMKGALRTSESFAVVNGSGLRMRTRSLQDLYHYSTGAQTVGFCGYMSLSQLAGYDASKPALLQWRYQDDNNNAPYGAWASVGLLSCGLNTTRPTDAERRTGALVQNETTPGGGSVTARGTGCWPGSSLSGWNYVTAAVPSDTPNRAVFQLQRGSWRTTLVEVSEQASATAWPGDFSTTPNAVSGFSGGASVTALVGVPVPSSATMPSLGVLFWYERHSAGGASDIAIHTLRSFRVLQPGVSL